jgi:hypothetical protein
MNRKVTLAAAIGAVLGTGAAYAAQPTLAQIEASTNNIFIAGSSAAKNAILGALVTNVCGGAANAFQFNSSGNGNFFAVSCVPVAAANAANPTAVYNMFYRDEGGSVVGMLPIVNSKSINQLSLVAGTIGGCAASPCNIPVTGTSSTNGVTDTFGPAGTVAPAPVDIGVADVEPAALTGNNYPTPYSTTVWGPVNNAGLVGLSGTQLFGEVYALFVNENSAAFIENPLNLSVQTTQQILTHKIKNWSLVTDTAGNTVTNASLAIQIVNREKGSGSRTATDLLLAGDACSTAGGVLFDTAGATDFFSTGDVLTAAAAIPGSITYATIDQTKTNMVMVNLDGVTPSNLAAATGQYPFWVEATYVQNPASTADAGVMAFIEGALQTEATAPHVADVLAIPGVPAAGPNVAHSVLSNSASAVPALGPATIFTNPFTRGGVTCNHPAFVATAQ